jgi:exosortase A
MTTPAPRSLGAASLGLPATLLQRASWLAFAAVLLLQFILWSETLRSLVAAWFRSGTFSHCPLIVVIAVVLAWRRRRTVQVLQPTPSIFGLALVIALNGLWLVGSAAGVLSLQHFSVVAVTPALVLAVLGQPIARALLFPLGYLLFAVPVGESLVPPLMNFTAEFTVGALRLIGIPVFQDGLYFSTSAGDFEVAKACSGVRYLIASVALGALFTHLMFRSWQRRIWFTVATIVVPLIANGLRAFLIVSLAHVSDMRFAVSVDHIIYGWIFFGFVMLLLFLAGLKFRETADSSIIHAADQARRAQDGGPSWRCLAAAVASVAVGVGTAAWSNNLHGNELPTVADRIALGPTLGPWVRESSAGGDWLPRFPSAAASALSSYGQAGVRVDVFVALYRDQRQGLEMISSDNAIFDASRWRRVSESSQHIDDAGPASAADVVVSHLRSGAVERSVWHWYVLGELQSPSAPLLKARLAWERLRGRHPASFAIAIATASGASDSRNDAILRQFLSSAGPALQANVRALSSA